jgi:hypothetical protein
MQPSRVCNSFRLTDSPFELAPFQRLARVDALEDAVQGLAPIVPDVAARALASKAAAVEPAPLTADEAGAIHLFVSEWSNFEDSLYFKLNQALESSDAAAVAPFVPFLHLLLTALAHVPAQHTPPVTLYRILSGNHINQISNRQASAVVWRGVSGLLELPDALDELLRAGEERTVVKVVSSAAVPISKYAPPSRREWLLVPARFSIHSRLTVAPLSHVVELHETSSLNFRAVGVPAASNVNEQVFNPRNLIVWALSSR